MRYPISHPVTLQDHNHRLLAVHSSSISINILPANIPTLSRHGNISSLCPILPRLSHQSSYFCRDSLLAVCQAISVAAAGGTSASNSCCLRPLEEDAKATCFSCFLFSLSAWFEVPVVPVGQYKETTGH